MVIVESDINNLLFFVERLDEKLNGKSWQGLMTAVARQVEGQVNERFINKTAPNGQAWQSLMPSTIKAKNGRDTILIDTGNLQGSLSSLATDKQAIVGFSSRYARYHQTGTKNLPARPMLGLNDDDRAEILDTVLAYLGE